MPATVATATASATATAATAATHQKTATTKKKKRRSKVIFAGTGLGWFPMPRYFLGDKADRGKFFKMAPSPDLRLYVVLLSEAGKGGEAVVTLENNHLMEFAGLNRTYLPRARKALVAARLIKAKRVSMSSHRYELLGPEGRPLWDRTPDDWGICSGLDFALQA